MRGVLAAMASVGIAFAVVLWLGFQLRPRLDGVSDTVFSVGVLIAIFVVSMCLFFAINGPLPWKLPAGRRPYTPSDPYGMGIDPGSGKHPSQVAYRGDLNMTATCEHLRPIEHAMRMAGVEVRLQLPSRFSPAVRAACKINEAALRQAFAVPECVTYSQRYEAERSEFDNPCADLLCTACSKTDRSRADLQVLHPEEAREIVPWFPSAP